jgi:menaquinol-cytochrome c reductase iron-sulfur subunit
MTEVGAGTPSGGAEQDPAGRRNFLARISVVIGALLALLPLAAGVCSFLDPLTRRRPFPLRYRGSRGAREGFFRVTPLDALPIGGPPRRFPVVADRIDGWNFIPQQPIGAVFLERLDEKSVRAFQATCPHAGCSVSYQNAAYHCPCHNSAFRLDGSKLNQPGKENPSPRNLDSLDVDPAGLAAGEVWVQYRDFYTGRAEKVAKT